MPNNLQTLVWMDDDHIIQPIRLLHRLMNLRKLGIREVSDSTIKILSSVSSLVPTTLPKALEVLKLKFSLDLIMEKINLSSYPNIVKLHLFNPETMPLNS